MDETLTTPEHSQAEEAQAGRLPAPYADHLAKKNAAADAVCWCCGGRTLDRHCKIVCTNCGFMRDCSDP